MRYQMGLPLWNKGELKETHFNEATTDPDKEKLESPDNEVFIPGFYIQRTEVTNKQFAHYYSSMESQGSLSEDIMNWHMAYKKEWKARQFEPTFDQLPVVFISEKGALAYARAMGGNLPSFRQRLLTASSRKNRREFVWDKNPSDLSDEERTKIAIGSGRRPVGVSTLDITEQGVVDLGGNVKEWVIDPRYQAGGAVCGASFDSAFSVEDCWIRHIEEFTGTARDVGFRVVLECPPTGEVP